MIHVSKMVKRRTRKVQWHWLAEEVGEEGRAKRDVLRENPTDQVVFGARVVKAAIGSGVEQRQCASFGEVVQNGAGRWGIPAKIHVAIGAPVLRGNLAGERGNNENEDGTGVRVEVVYGGTIVLSGAAQGEEDTMTLAIVGPQDKKRLLSIDGGGLCGLIPAQCLIEMEAQLNELTQTDLPLGRRFDLIGGTSTGAILAAGLCLGWKARDLSDFYIKYGAEIFRKLFPVAWLWHKYPSGPLIAKLQEKFGKDTTLGSDALLTNLVVVSKNATHGDTWFFTNNKAGSFWSIDKDLPLWQVVRASTAAPTYFPPQRISIPGSTGKTNEYEFVDGGVSSFNNPAFQVFLEATEPSYKFGWQTGTDNLLLLSLGTGYNTQTIWYGRAAWYTLLNWAGYSVKVLLNDANLQQNVLMRLVGEKPSPTTRTAMQEMDASGLQTGAPSAVALEQVSTALGATKLLTYQRMTVSLTRARLDGLKLPDIDPVKVREMDAVDQMENMKRIGEKIAEEQVHMESLTKFFV